MKANPILQAKATGGRTVGAWLTLGNSFVAEMLGKLGFDWIVIDRQHGSVEWNTVGAAIQAIELGGSCAVVRVEWNSPDLIMRALDLGAVGVIVPMVSTAADARRAAEAARYPPHGIRSFGPTRNYYSVDAERVEPACIVMIETREAMDNLQAIVTTPGVDGVFVGPADLALDLGVPISLPMHQSVTAAIDKTVGACAAAGILPGAASFSVQNASDFLGQGVRLLTLGADVSYLRRGAQPDIEFLQGLGKTSRL
jgi:4-hydroxy-2-oxoheptanedioate aldolase